MRLDARHRGDARATEREHIETHAYGRAADAGRGSQVHSERRLPVGSRRHELESAARGEDAGAEERREISTFVRFPRATNFAVVASSPGEAAAGFASCPFAVFFAGSCALA